MFLHLSRKHYILLKEQVYRLDGGKCHICGKRVTYEEAHLDHVIPSGWGATTEERNALPISSSDSYWNIRISHQACNSRRGRGRKIPGQLRLKEEDLCVLIGKSEEELVHGTARAKGRSVRLRRDTSRLIMTDVLDMQHEDYVRQLEGHIAFLETELRARHAEAMSLYGVLSSQYGP